MSTVDPNLPPHLDRDFVGYGRNPPPADWPGGARVAVHFVINYEEGSAYSFPDGDGFSEASLTESQDSPNGPGSRDLQARSEDRRVGTECDRTCSSRVSPAQ